MAKIQIKLILNIYKMCAAPKGNKFALGNTWGRPPKYEHPEDLANKILEFIEHSEEQGDSLTITGLCLYLGFESRSSFDKQAERDDDFSYIVKRAKMVVEQRYEEGLNSPACTGSIFALKNMGWKDKTETEHSGNMGITWNETKTYPDAPEPESNPGA